MFLHNVQISAAKSTVNVTVIFDLVKMKINDKRFML